VSPRSAPLLAWSPVVALPERPPARAAVAGAIDGYPQLVNPIGVESSVLDPLAVPGVLPDSQQLSLRLRTGARG
jgi:hypothetical protein